MISCVYALLLLTRSDEIYDKSSLASKFPSKQLPNLRRLVLLAEGTKQSFYGDFKAHDFNEAPKVVGDHDIFKTKKQRIHENKILQAYCSPTLSSMQIARIMERQLSSIDKFEYPKLDNRALSSENCLEAIYKELEGVEKGSSSETRVITQSSTCSNSDIIGLAFQGDISVSGVYYPYAPTNYKNVPKVAFKGPLDLQDLLTEHQIYAAWKKSNSQMVLVWYFGQLHIFRRDGMNQLWWPVTEIGSTEHNGAIIINFLRHKLGLLQRLDKKLESSVQSRSMWNFVRRPSSSVQTSKDKLMAEIVSMELDKPVMVSLSYLSCDLGEYLGLRRIEQASL